MIATDERILRHAHLQGILELLCQGLELTPTQQSLAEERYRAIGEWLCSVEEGPLRTASIYPQGSVALETTVKPPGQEEFDLDLVCHLPGASSDSSPGSIKALVGDRLRAHATYAEMLDEKQRCWRVTYANDFHLDITPSVRNLSCWNGGELVPDKKLQKWKATNPKGYRQWFEQQAILQPRMLLERRDMAAKRAEIESLPVPSRLKGVLRRTVQLCKRHRDETFSAKGGPATKLAPISIILTTLAAKSYASCVGRREYETDLDLLLEILRGMPEHIEVAEESGRRLYFVWNETTQGENFAEKWNDDPRLPGAFFQWHERALSQLLEVMKLTGLDAIHRHLSEAFGAEPVRRAAGRISEDVGEARLTGLAVSPGLGLTVQGSGAPIRTNTFYGR